MVHLSRFIFILLAFAARRFACRDDTHSGAGRPDGLVGVRDRQQSLLAGHSQRKPTLLSLAGRRIEDREWRNVHRCASRPGLVYPRGNPWSSYRGIGLNGIETGKCLALQPTLVRLTIRRLIDGLMVGEKGSLKFLFACVYVCEGAR